MMKVLLLLCALLPATSAFAPAPPARVATGLGYDGSAKGHPINGGLPHFNPASRERAQEENLDATPVNQASYIVTGSQSTALSRDPAAFPANLPLQQLQGGGSRLTYKMPQGADRAQIYIASHGRPLKARVELWLGPVRRVHFIDISCMNGAESPYRGCIKFKNTDSAGPQTLEISTSDDQAFPALVGVDVMTPDRSKERTAAFDAVWKASTKLYSQGNKSVRFVPIADHVKSIQLLVWSKDVGKKSFKAAVELLQGPNCKRQSFELQCGGGTQPYHAVFQVPGPGWTLRWKNTKTLHDGSVEFAVVPYEVEDDALPPSDQPAPYANGYAERSDEFGYANSLGPHGNRVWHS